MWDAPLRVQGRIDCVFKDARCNRCIGENIIKIFAKPASRPTFLKTSQCNFDSLSGHITQGASVAAATMRP
jgi:hypothetical protein